MKCVISGGNIKYLARAIYLLSKIGDEMFLQPQEDCLSFRSVNASNSAFVDVTLYENFFSYYAYENLEENDALRCKILIRSALAVFKTPSLLEKQVESCHIQLDTNSESVCFILKYRNSVIKTHLLPILDSETIKANYKKEGTANHLCIQPKVMNDVVQNFQQNLLEITIEVQKDKVLMRNYIDETSSISNETRTQLVFGVGEFDEYMIDSDTAITFCLKELRAIVHFAEILSKPIDIHFDLPGRPVVFICKSSTLESNLVLATLNPDTDTGSQSTVSSKPNTVTKKPTTKKMSTKPRGEMRSMSKKSINDSKKSIDTMSTESPGKISNFSETPKPKCRKDSDYFSTKLPSKPNSSNVTSDNGQNVNSFKKNPFSSFLKRKSDDDIVNNDNDDLIQNSPPRQSKRAKLIFKKCFQTTFDPRMLPGHNDVEVEDSGESD